jgi:tellurite resistance protein
VPVVRFLVRESRNQIEVAGPSARARAIGRQLAERDAADEGLRLGLAIAFASDGFSAPERERLAMVAKAAGMSEARLDALAASAASSPVTQPPSDPPGA